MLLSGLLLSLGCSVLPAPGGLRDNNQPSPSTEGGLLRSRSDVHGKSPQKDQEIVRLTQEIARLTQEIERLGRKNVELTAASQTKLDEAHTLLKALERDRDNLKKQVVEQGTAAEQALAQLQARSDELEEQKAAAKRSSDQLQARSDELTRQQAAAERALSQKRAEIDKQKGELAALQARIKVLEAQAVQGKSGTEQTAQQYQRTLQEKEEDIARIRTQQEIANRALVEKETAATALAAKIATLEQQQQKNGRGAAGKRGGAGETKGRISSVDASKRRGGGEFKKTG